MTGELGIYVTPETRDAVVAMAAAARKQGIRLEVDSGFRSYGFQKRVLEGLLAKGRPFLNAIRWTAPPGYSEHITGRALDFVPSDADFKDVPAYEWLRPARGRLLFRRERTRWATPGASTGNPGTGATTTATSSDASAAAGPKPALRAGCRRGRRRTQCEACFLVRSG